MITRPMSETPVLTWRGHSDATLTPLPYQQSMGAHGGWPGPIIRRKAFGFRPRLMVPVNVVRGGPRLYG